MADQTINVTVSDDRATVLLDRPEKRNAMTAQTFVELRDAVESFRGDPPSILTIRGAGGDFSAGVDMGGVPEWAKQRPLEVRDQLEDVHDTLRTIESLDAPVIAALEGYVLGGGLELALACDIRIASMGARFGLPEATLGLAMDLGGAQKLPSFIGEGMTKYLVMTGEHIDAQRANDIGLVEKLVPSNEFEAELSALEDRLADQPTYVMGLAKRQVHSARPPHLGEAMNQAIHHAIAAYHETETQRRVGEFLKD